MAQAYVRQQTKGEEIANAVSHGVGALLALVGAAILTAGGVMSGSRVTAASLAAYGFSLVLLYTASAVYHAVTNERWKAALRVMDHCSIYLLIWDLIYFWNAPSEHCLDFSFKQNNAKFMG